MPLSRRHSCGNVPNALRRQGTLQSDVSEVIERQRFDKVLRTRFAKAQPDRAVGTVLAPVFFLERREIECEVPREVCLASLSLAVMRQIDRCLDRERLHETLETIEGKIMIWPGHDWFCLEEQISRLDPTARQITMDKDTRYTITPANRYFITNILGLLDQPGEYQIGLRDSVIYVKPLSGPIMHQNYIFSTAKNVICVQGTDKNPVRNLHFENLDSTIAEEPPETMTRIRLLER